MDHRAPAHDRDVPPFAEDVRAAEGHDVVVAWIARAAITRHQQRTMLEKNRRIGAAHCASHEPTRIRRMRRHGDLPTIRVRKPHFIAETVPWVPDVFPE